jgi:hypothetical protein
MQAVLFPAAKTSPGYHKPSKIAQLLLDFDSLFVKKADCLNAPATLTPAAKLNCIAVVHTLVDADKSPYSACKDAQRVSTLLAAIRLGISKSPKSYDKTTKTTKTATSSSPEFPVTFRP